MVEDTPARRLVAGGIAFNQAALHIIEGDGSGALWAVAFVNLGFAIELSLKGFLLARGCQRSELKKLGHNLIKLLARAEELGFLVKNPELSRYVESVSPGHADLSLRYMEGGPEIMLPSLRDLHQAVRLLSFSCASQGEVFSIEKLREIYDRPAQNKRHSFRAED